MGKSPFEIMYGRNPIILLDLSPLVIIDQFSVEGDEQSSKIKELHQQVHMHIEKHNKQYDDHAKNHYKQVVYPEGDLVWLHLRKERFSNRRFSKLHPRLDGPFVL